MQTVDLDIRPYRDEDLPAVLECLTASLGGGPAGRRPPEFFRWKHHENPFGRSFMLLAEADGRIAGVRAFMRWRFHAGQRVLSAVRAVDTATHPDFQGKGIFSTLTLAALEALRNEGVDFVYNTPNEASLPGYLKMGWQVIGRVPVSIRARNPFRVAAKYRATSGTPPHHPAVDAPSVAEVLAADGIGDLFAGDEGADVRLHTARDASYLAWRYGNAPLMDYRAIRDDAGGRVGGLAIFRVRPRGALWETTISELIVRQGDTTAARRLLRAVRAAARVDHLACHFAAGSTQAAAMRRGGYVRAPGGMMFVANPLREHIEPEPTRLASWALSIGDLEVF